MDNSLRNKPDGYETWLSNQHTGFCGNRTQVGYYSGHIDGGMGCPNCGERKTTAHLCICPDNDITRLLSEMAKDLEKWMVRDSTTYAEIVYWVPKYIMFRGTKKFVDMGMMSSAMIVMARSQDKIGWRNFMEGRISK